MNDTKQELTSAEEAILAASQDDESLAPIFERKGPPAIFITDWEMMHDLMGIPA